jgi:hypothetical protein
MANLPVLTPQALRERAQRAIRLAEGTTDAQAKAALLAYAQESNDMATQLEAGSTQVAGASAGEAAVAATAQAPQQENAVASTDEPAPVATAEMPPEETKG